MREYWISYRIYPWSKHYNEAFNNSTSLCKRALCWAPIADFWAKGEMKDKLSRFGFMVLKGVEMTVLSKNGKAKIQAQQDRMALKGNRTAGHNSAQGQEYTCVRAHIGGMCYAL